jgi:hypothetical protein
MGALCRIKAENLKELDNVIADASNIFNNASIRFTEGKYKVGALTFAALGLVTMESGFAISMLELSKDGSLALPFSDMLKPDYLPQLLSGNRELVGEYISAAGLAVAGLSAPMAKLATVLSNSLHSMASDPLTRLYNMIGNNVSEEFRQRNINQIVNGVALYYQELSKNTPHDEALSAAWSKIDESLIHAKGMSTDLIAGDVISNLNERLSDIKTKRVDAIDLDYENPIQTMQFR